MSVGQVANCLHTLTREKFVNRLLFLNMKKHGLSKLNCVPRLWTHLAGFRLSVYKARGLGLCFERTSYDQQNVSKGTLDAMWASGREAVSLV